MFVTVQHLEQQMPDATLSPEDDDLAVQQQVSKVELRLSDEPMRSPKLAAHLRSHAC